MSVRLRLPDARGWCDLVCACVNMLGRNRGASTSLAVESRNDCVCPDGVMLSHGWAQYTGSPPRLGLRLGAGLGHGGGPGGGAVLRVHAARGPVAAIAGAYRGAGGSSQRGAPARRWEPGVG